MCPCLCLLSGCGLLSSLSSFSALRSRGAARTRSGAKARERRERRRLGRRRRRATVAGRGRCVSIFAEGQENSGWKARKDSLVGGFRVSHSSTGSLPGGATRRARAVVSREGRAWCRREGREGREARRVTLDEEKAKPGEVGPGVLRLRGCSVPGQKESPTGQAHGVLQSGTVVVVW